MMLDEDIMDRYWQRDEEAIGQTKQKYGAYLLKIAYNILFDREDSEESVNDIYLRAWHSMPPQRPKAELLHFNMENKGFAVLFSGNCIIIEGRKREGR